MDGAELSSRGRAHVFKEAAAAGCRVDAILARRTATLGKDRCRVAGLSEGWRRWLRRFTPPSHENRGARVASQCLAAQARRRFAHTLLRLTRTLLCPPFFQIFLWDTTADSARSRAARCNCSAEIICRLGLGPSRTRLAVHESPFGLVGATAALDALQRLQVGRRRPQLPGASRLDRYHDVSKHRRVSKGTPESDRRPSLASTGRSPAHVRHRFLPAWCPALTKTMLTSNNLKPTAHGCSPPPSAARLSNKAIIAGVRSARPSGMVTLHVISRPLQLLRPASSSSSSRGFD